MDKGFEILLLHKKRIDDIQELKAFSEARRVFWGKEEKKNPESYLNNKEIPHTQKQISLFLILGVEGCA